MKNSLVLILSLLSIALVSGQTKEHKTINIDAAATVTIPADIVVFNLNLKADAPAAKMAYQLHKEQEKNLLKLIDSFNIPDSNITYSLMRISRRAPYNNNPERFETYQTVEIKLNSVKQYDDFQINLLDGGIYNFGSNFSSSQIDEAKKDALNNALQKAESDAKQIALQIGKKIGGVLEVNFGTRPNIQRQDVMMMTDAKASITEIPQQLTVSVQVNVVYEITD